jgi:transcription initiation factor TFIIIB Brf1 subunit/transcription initiation factor TFIIB
MTQSESVEVAISSYASNLHLSIKSQTRARDIVARAESAGLTQRKKPEAILAAAVNIAGILEREPHTLAKIDKITGVSPNTV